MMRFALAWFFAWFLFSVYHAATAHTPAYMALHAAGAAADLAMVVMCATELRRRALARRARALESLHHGADCAVPRRAAA